MSRETEIATISRDNPYVILNNEDPDNEDTDTITPIAPASIVTNFSRETRTIYINGMNNTCVEVPIEIAEKALKIQNELKRIISFIYEEGSPAGIKCLLNKMKVCDNNLRLPLLQVSEKLNYSIEMELKSLISN